ncbi:hypothetical protein [Candidatus Viridilinea mediisalina]|uniref:Uncharacterized protein n=1 Tax=Candidatus Viridilinea mediisalina TaxID=2024553 RepID=A0A2A6RPS4_9CHLR|nr:hypothetical protein [Candidatus Viridilinea mediisalina]PDW05017.1 hypothetical protein CJ255_00040 [Candidatus Viridilinea mediisalina]
MNRSLHKQLQRLASDRWARRGLRLLLRAAMLALLLLGGTAALQLFSEYTPNWAWVNAAALTCIGVGAALVLRRPLAPSEVARDLDRRFRLNEQLSTALEIAQPTNGVTHCLHEQSRRTMHRLQPQIALQQVVPRREVVATALLLFTMGGLLLLNYFNEREVLAQAGPDPPPVATEPALVVPPPPLEAPPPPQPFMATESDMIGEALVPLTDPNDLAAAAALAEALRNQSVTRPAAEALDRGNAAEAAQQLRDLADQAASLASETRGELAQGLRQAANQIEPLNPALANQVRGAADALATTGVDPAQGFEGLAAALEQLAQGQRPSQQADGSGNPAGGGGGASGQHLAGQQRESVNQRLGVDGVPLELESDGPGGGATGGAASDLPLSASEGGTGATFARGSPDSNRVEVGGDPLRIPLDLRDVVQDYFSP